MDARQLSSTAFAISGVFVLMAAIRLVVGLFTYPVFLHEEKGMAMLLLLLLHLIVVLTVGVILIVKRHRLAEWAMGDPHPGHQQDTSVLSDVLVVATGVFLIANTMPSVGYLIPQILFELRDPNGIADPRLAGPAIGQLIGTGAQVIIGTFLIVKHSAITGRLKSKLEKQRSPNLGVAADRDPRERGSRPLNTDR